MSPNDMNCEEEVFLKKLIQDFFRCTLKYSLQAKDIELLTWNIQETFLNATVRNDLVKKYPVNSKFSRIFFKKLIELLEPRQEVHDDFYTYLCSVMSECDEDFHYRHYVVGNDFNNLITMKETNNMVTNGTTGMRTWEAALMLADWALCTKHRFTNKKVLELGSGIGFTGVTISKLCDIDSLVMTDCHHDVLRTICENIEINFSNINKIETACSTVFRIEKKTIEVMMLDWNSTEDFDDDIVPDIIIGADIVYDTKIIQPLCNTIAKFSERNKNLEVYIANIIRNRDTIDYFLNTLVSMNFKYEMIPQIQSCFLDWDKDIERCLLKINMNKQKISLFNE